VPSRSPCPPNPPLSTSRIFRILPTASKGFFTKKTIRKKNALFPYRTCKTHCLQPQIFALNLAYTGNWTHVQHNTGKTTIYAHLVLTFFIDHHILCLQLLVKIYPLSPFTCFLQINCNFFSGRQIHYSQSLPCSALGISHLMFSRFVVLKYIPRLISSTLPVVTFVQRLRVYFFCQNARE